MTMRRRRVVHDDTEPTLCVLTMSMVCLERVSPSSARACTTMQRATSACSAAGPRHGSHVCREEWWRPSAWECAVADEDGRARMLVATLTVSSWSTTQPRADNSRVDCVAILQGIAIGSGADAGKRRLVVMGCLPFQDAFFFECADAEQHLDDFRRSSDARAQVAVPLVSSPSFPRPFRSLRAR